MKGAGAGMTQETAASLKATQQLRRAAILEPCTQPAGSSIGQTPFLHSPYSFTNPKEGPCDLLSFKDFLRLLSWLLPES